MNKRLFTAAGSGLLESVRELIEQGADVNGSHQFGWTPLINGSFSGHESIVSLLLEKGAEVDKAGNSGWTALLSSSQNGHLSVLLARGADVDKTDAFGNPALHVAAGEGRKSVVSLLLDHSANVNSINRYKVSSLMHASQFGHEAVVRLLLSHPDIDTTFRDDHGKDCLDWANKQSIKQLIISHRQKKEKQMLINIGLAFADMQLPVLTLVHIYQESVIFPQQEIPRFQGWEILKLLKKPAGK